LVMRQAEKSGKPPSARWTIGRDESGTDYTVLYADTRGVSRVYRMSFAEGLWKLWRNSPNFSQRFEGHVNSDKRHHHLALGKLP